MEITLPFNFPAYIHVMQCDQKDLTKHDVSLSFQMESDGFIRKYDKYAEEINGKVTFM